MAHFFISTWLSYSLARVAQNFVSIWLTFSLTFTEARIKSVLENDGTTRHREEAVALLKSSEGKKAIRQARKERDETETIHKTANKAH